MVCTSIVLSSSKLLYLKVVFEIIIIKMESEASLGNESGPYFPEMHKAHLYFEDNVVTKTAEEMFLSLENRTDKEIIGE